jgi:hypothetical protein
MLSNATPTPLPMAIPTAIQIANWLLRFLPGPSPFDISVLLSKI